MLINNKCIHCSDTGMVWKVGQGGDYQYCECEKGKEKSGKTYLAPEPLNFRKLRNLNIQRCTSENGFNHPLEGWSIGEWGTATGGELGEHIEILLFGLAAYGKANNIAKKLLRVRDGVKGNKETPVELKNEFAEELADVFIYLDLWAASQGIDLEQAIISKFNKTSDKISSTIKL